MQWKIVDALMIISFVFVCAADNSTGNLRCLQGKEENQTKRIAEDSSQSTNTEEEGEVSKRFYFFSGPEEEIQDDAESNRTKHVNYNIIFAKTPEPDVSSAVKAYKRLAGQRQTVVYVLTKKLDTDEISNQLRASKLKLNKPEVHFIKYRTPEEADYAQVKIRESYEALSGNSEILTEETVPVLFVIGSSRKERSKRTEVQQFLEGRKDLSFKVPPPPFKPVHYSTPSHVVEVSS